MFKRMIKSLAICIAGLVLIVPFAFAQETSLSTIDELMEQMQVLRLEVSQVRDNAERARQIAVDSRLDSQMFKEETLCRLALWRERLGEGMMISIAALDAAQRAEKLAKTADEQVRVALSKMGKDIDALKIDVSLAKEMAATCKAQCETAIKRIDGRMDALSRDVDTLKADVSLAKEMAATAKAQADQARREVRDLGVEVRKTRELFLEDVDKVIDDLKIKEQTIKPDKVELKAPHRMIYTVQRGDSLWSIAARPDVYNNPNEWKKIFEANRDKLATPDRLYPGLKLMIP